MEQPRVVRSVLSPARAATRDKLVASVITLATEGGYDATGLRQVAAHAEVSVPTVYQHVGSRDQLLVEALMALGARSTESLRRRRPRGYTPAERLSAVFAAILREAAAKPLLYQAIYRAYVASAPALVGVDGLVGFGPEKAKWIGETLRAGDTGGHSDGDIDAVARILSALFLGTMIGVAAGRDVDEATAIITDATHRLLP